MELKVVGANIVEGRQIIFLNLGVLPGEKVDTYFVLTKIDRAKLGEISWYGEWGKYVFVPEKPIILEETCLQDILDFIVTRTCELKIN